MRPAFDWAGGGDNYVVYSCSQMISGRYVGLVSFRLVCRALLFLPARALRKNQ